MINVARKWPAWPANGQIGAKVARFSSGPNAPHLADSLNRSARMNAKLAQWQNKWQAANGGHSTTEAGFIRALPRVGISLPSFQADNFPNQ
jgi:hypothetical protein